MWEFFTTNWIGLVLATVSAMVIGYIWYSKPVFGKQWQKLNKLKDSELTKGMAKTMTVMLVMAFVTAFVLMRFLVISNPQSLVEALKVAGWLWLGLVAAITIGSNGFEHKPYSLTAINIGYQLVNLLVMTTILYYVN